MARLALRYFRNGLQHVGKDLRHIFYNLPLSLVAILFYRKFGFMAYGWSHLILLLCWTVLIYSLDDWLDERKNGSGPPFYNYPLLVVALAISPVITIVSLTGVVLINARALLGRSSFWLEEVESISEMLVFVPIYFYPIGAQFPQSYLESIPVVYMIDKVHKLGHGETIDRGKSLVRVGLVSVIVIVLTIWHNRDLELFIAMVAILLMLMIPVVSAKNKKTGWYAFQLWQAFAVPMIVYYMLFYMWNKRFLELIGL